MQDKHVGNGIAGGSEGAALPPPGPPSGGTAPSNTVPPNSRDSSDTFILRSGIDSLYLSYQGGMSEDRGIQLARCKELAQSPNRDYSPLAQVELGGHLFEVGDRGRGIFPYVLRDGWYQLQVSKPYAVNKPLAYVAISSGLLTTQSLAFILDDLRECVAALGHAPYDPGLSRVDLCCDFVTSFPMSDIQECQWLTRARHIDRHQENKAFTGFSIGRGGALTARLYNKTIEIQKNPRPYLQKLWSDAGWNGWDQVWRLEFQFRREALNEFGAFSADALNHVLAGLWRYATTEWLRLVMPSDSDSTPSRWPTASLWEVLQGVPWIGDPHRPRIPIETQRVPSDRNLFVNGLGGLTSFMAVHGFTLIQDAANAFIIAARDYHDRRELFTGKNFQDYILERVREKQRQFNTAVNVPANGVHPATQAVANAYRKAKDGE